ILSDFNLPITPKSERVLFAVETNNEEKLAMTVEKAMKTDETAHRREIDGHVIWEIIAEEQELPPLVTLEGSSAPAAPQEDEMKLPNSAVTVCNGQLYIATHIDFLLKVLAEKDSKEQLANCVDYKTVRAEMERLSSGEHCVQAFSRTDEEYRAVYELIRADKM